MAPSPARRRAWTAWALVAPALLVLAATAVWPLARTIGYSFTDVNLAALDRGRMVGFANYLARDPSGEWGGLLADPDWWRAVWNTVRFAVISVAIEICLGTVFALVLDRAIRLRGWLRAAVMVPWAIPTVVSAKIWALLLDGQFGAVNDLLARMHLIDNPVAWASDPDLVMASIIAVDVWKTTPFVALLVLAALQSAPRECYEAAHLDGVSAWQVFVRITLPMIRPTLTVAIVFRMLDAMRVFDVVYVLTGTTAETMSMSVFARQQLVDFQEIGYGSAASTMLFVIVAVFTAIYLRVIRPGPGAAGEPGGAP
jgi:trehalose/maltose transport system permease protein